MGKKLFQYYGNILPHHAWFRQLYESDIIKYSITGSRACMILPFRKNEYYGPLALSFILNEFCTPEGALINSASSAAPIDSTRSEDAGIKPRTRIVNAFKEPGNGFFQGIDAASM